MKFYILFTKAMCLNSFERFVYSVRNHRQHCRYE